MLTTIILLALWNLVMFYMLNGTIVKLQNKVTSLESRMQRHDKAEEYAAIDKRKERLGL